MGTLLALAGTWAQSHGGGRRRDVSGGFCVGQECSYPGLPQVRQLMFGDACGRVAETGDSTPELRKRRAGGAWAQA